MLNLTDKQIEYIKNSTERWNIKTGAVRSGKTYSDFFLLPYRIKNAGEGLVLLIGNTRMSLERNILSPMRNIWGENYIGRINGDGFVRLFDRDCYTLGGGTENACEKIQGCSVAYCYGDEITTWSESLFRMLQSRLDKPYSRFDGSCNPDSPTHWFKSFLDGTKGIYHQHYTIEDNPYLEKEYVDFLKNSYRGTVYYDRFILGRWVNAEGLVYPVFADNPGEYIVKSSECGGYDRVICGMDFGGNRSRTAIVSVGINYPDGNDRYVSVCALRSELRDIKSPAHLTEFVSEFMYKTKCDIGYFPETVYCDSAETMLIRGLKGDFAEDDALYGISIRSAAKTRVRDRIFRTNLLISRNMLTLTENASTLKNALCTAVWADSEKRADDFSSDIDTLDAFEYAIEQVNM